MRNSSVIALAVAAMASVIIASNFLVQMPVNGQVGAVNLADILTWGAFTYPFAFLVTDVTNRRVGPVLARRVVFAGFAIAVATPLLLEQVANLPPSTTRIVLASGTAFLVAQLLDIAVFQRLRGLAWWRAPLVSSVVGSAIDTALFFTLAFTALIAFQVDGFAVATSPLLGVENAPEMPRWISWAIADFGVKMLVAMFALIPFRLVIAYALASPRTN